MAKTRVATRVKAVVGGKKSHNQSEDLVKLAEKYHVFVKRLQALIASLKEHYGAMQNIAKTRFKVRRIYAVARTKVQFSAVQDGLAQIRCRRNNFRFSRSDFCFAAFVH
jgi:hypothetical protein